MESTLAKINRLSGQFSAEAAKAQDGNKSAGVRARKLSLEIGELFKKYRKETV